jgi:hypothetical protein
MQGGFQPLRHWLAQQLYQQQQWQGLAGNPNPWRRIPF